MSTSFFRNKRARASAAHFVFSAILAAACAALVYLLWYPGPLGSMSGVSDLFVLMLGVDVVLGPLVTLVVFNSRKPRAELVRDLALVVVVQLGALGFGMWTVFAGRPVHGVFEYDRIRVVHANEIPEEFMDRVPPGVVDGLRQGDPCDSESRQTGSGADGRAAGLRRALATSTGRSQPQHRQHGVPAAG